MSRGSYTILPTTGNGSDSPIALRTDDRARARAKALVILATRG